MYLSLNIKRQCKDQDQSYVAVDDVEIDPRETGQHFQESLNIGLAREKFEISFLINVTASGSPSDDRIVTRSSIHIWLIKTKANADLIIKADDGVRQDKSNLRIDSQHSFFVEL